jgi:hypothetical protein
MYGDTATHRNRALDVHIQSALTLSEGLRFGDDNALPPLPGQGGVVEVFGGSVVAVEASG